MKPDSELYRQALAWAGERLIAERKRRRRKVATQTIEWSGGRKVRKRTKKR